MHRIDVLNEEVYVPKTPDQCMHKNDWPKWKDALKAKLDLLDKRNVFWTCSPNSQKC